MTTPMSSKHAIGFRMGRVTYIGIKFGCQCCLHKQRNLVGTTVLSVSCLRVKSCSFTRWVGIKTHINGTGSYLVLRDFGQNYHGPKNTYETTDFYVAAVCHTTSHWACWTSFWVCETHHINSEIIIIVRRLKGGR